MKSKKEIIIEAARSILIREGSSGFSMRKVAVEASMSLGNLQYYYETKTDLLYGLLNSYIDSYKREYEKFLLAGMKDRGDLRHLIHSTLEEEASNEDLPFFRALFSFTEQDLLEKFLNLFYQEVYALLCEGLAQLVNLPNDALVVHRAASLLLPYFDGYGLSSPHLGIDREEIADILTDLVWDWLNS